MSDLSSWAEWLAQTVAETVAGRRCSPRATYRVQFVPGSMTFRGAAGLASYLDELGVSHLYASPYLKTRAGSSHGYAIVDYAQLNPALGGEDDYRAMVAALHGRGMGQIVDVVPNHMSTAPAENAWWNDVLENGPSFAARGLLRHRLAARERGTAGQGAPAHPRRPVRPGPRTRRTEAGVSRGRVRRCGTTSRCCRWTRGPIARS